MSQVFGRKWSVWMADSVLQKFPELRKKWSYDYGVICKGIEKVYESTNDSKYFDYIKNNMDYFLLDDGSIRYYDKELYNIDYINNGKCLIYLYKKTGDDKYKKAVELLRSQLNNHPRTSEGGFFHKKMYTNQMWLDGLYMGQPFYAEYINTFEEDKDYSDVILQFKLIDKHLRDEKTNFLYHGFDEKREMFWADKDTGRSQCFWGRSVGWYACALVDTLDFIEEDADKQTLINMVSNLAEGLKNAQSEKTGVWSQVLDREGDFGNYYESSCSCMFTYFLLKAVRKGYIDKEYYKCAKKAFQGIISEFIEVGENGLLNLKNTVYAGGLGGDGLRDGSYEYYISEPKMTNSLLGIGAFLMASAEIDFGIIGEYNE